MQFGVDAALTIAVVLVAVRGIPALEPPSEAPAPVRERRSWLLGRTGLRFLLGVVMLGAELGGGSAQQYRPRAGPHPEQRVGAAAEVPTVPVLRAGSETLVQRQARLVLGAES